MIVNNVAKDIYYIENVIANPLSVLDTIESSDKNPDLWSVIPQWQDWVLRDIYNKTVFISDEIKGYRKTFNWDGYGCTCPEDWKWNDVDINATPVHKKCYDEIIKPIEDALLKVLGVWS